MQTQATIEIHVSATTSKPGAAVALVRRRYNAGVEHIATYCYYEPSASQLALLLGLVKNVVEDLDLALGAAVIRCRLLSFTNIFSTWGAKWKRNGWRTSDGNKPQHCERIQELMPLLEQSNIAVEQASDSADIKRCDQALQEARLRANYYATSTPASCIKTTTSAKQIVRKPS